MNELIAWAQTPGQWNDGVLLCGAVLVAIVVVMILNPNKD
jgi:hypothetical protein